MLKPLFQPIWSCEIALSIALISTFMIACTTENAVLSTLLFGFTQIVAGWVGHSMAHNRHPLFMKYGRVIPGITGGFSLEWWSPKHNMHHIFTNSKLYDDDIKHDYKVYLYEFLYLKWRFDSLISTLKHFNIVTYFSYESFNSFALPLTTPLSSTTIKTCHTSYWEI